MSWFFDANLGLYRALHEPICLFTNPKKCSGQEAEVEIFSKDQNLLVSLVLATNIVAEVSKLDGGSNHTSDHRGDIICIENILK